VKEENKRMPTIRFYLGAVLAVLIVSVVSMAQTGTIAGTVSDASGAVVQGAEVTVRNTATNESHKTTSSTSGTYAVTDLPIGPYEITVKKEGFKLFRQPGIELTVAQSFTVDPKLTPGAASEEVTVRADRVQDIDLETSQLSNLVDQRQMESLPLITRNPYQLMLLSPGTSQTDSSNGGVSVNGARDRNNNFLLDGVDNNDTSVPGQMGGVLNANPESTEEFRIITDNFNAEYGRNTGAIVDVVTKSGTNSLHGNLYYFGRWNGFGGARDYFNPGVGPNAGPMNPYIRHQFGFSIGGPIIKNKTFFFFNDEMDRFLTTLTNPGEIPTQGFLNGQFNYTYVDTSFVQHTVPIDLVDTPGTGPGGSGNNPSVNFTAGSYVGNPVQADPTMQKVFAYYPIAPAASSFNGISGTTFFPSASNTHTYNPIVKLDHHFTDRESFSLRYAYNHFYDPNPFHSDFLPGGIGDIASKDIDEGVAAQLTSTLSNHLVNNLQFGWNHIYATFYLSKATTNELDAPAGTDTIGNGWDYALDPFSSFASTLSGADMQERKTGTISYTESLSWVHGNHTFKFGFDFRDVGESGFDNFSSRRQLTLDPEAAFEGFNPGQSPPTGPTPSGIVANAPFLADGTDLDRALVDGADAYYGDVIEDAQSQFFNKTAARQPSDNKNFKQHEFDWYGQDTWKIRPNFTLSLGLRYQYNGVPYETGGNLSNLLQDPGSFATGQPVTFTVVGPGSGHQLYQPDYKDIEPRIGFSWDPWKDGKTAVRAGFGVFHDRTFGNAFGNVRADPPFQGSYTNFPGITSTGEYGETINNAFGSGTFPGCTGGVPPCQQPPVQPVSPSIADQSLVSGIVVFDTHFPNAASNNWNLDIQRQLPGNNVIDIAYVGAMGVHIYGQRDGNPPDPNLVAQLVAYCSVANVYGCTPETVSGALLYEGFEFGELPFDAVNNNALFQPDYQINEYNSIYHGLQTKFTHRMSHGLQFQAAYTWSHALDDSVDPLTPAVGAHTFPRNSRDLAQNYGNSDNDTRNVAVINYIWELPFGRGKGYLNHGVAGRVMEGFELDGIFSAQTGHPFQVRGTLDTQRTGIAAWGYQVGNPFGSGAGCGLTPTPNSGYAYIPNECAFTNPPFGFASNNERNQWYGPGFWDWDVTLAKRMTITERVRAELRFEGYNILNHPHFLNPGTDAAGIGNLIGQSQFGVITNTYTQPDGTTSARQIQVALKIKF
jgi:Carboxypeptidase regulatory-like domain/TonB-dependent Receptor Plug Domain